MTRRLWLALLIGLCAGLLYGALTGEQTMPPWQW